MIKRARIYNGEKTVFNKWGNAKIEQLHTKESNGLLYQTMHKNKFTNETIKLLEKNGSTIFAIGPHNIFYMSPGTGETKAKINK